MAYGLYTQNNMQGLIDSNYSINIVVASGSVSYSGGTTAQPLSNLRRRSISNVTLTKHVNMDMAEAYDPNFVGDNYGRLKVGAYYYTSGGHAGFYGGSISENSSSITFERFDIDSGNQNSLAASSISGTLYVVLVASLASVQQQMPSYGICFYNSSGQVTFNSNYMPAIPKAFISQPNPDVNNAANYNTGRVRFTGVSNTNKPMVPLSYIARAKINGGITNLATVYNTDGYVSARSSGYVTATAYPPSKYGYRFTAGSILLPVLQGSDYF